MRAAVITAIGSVPTIVEREPPPSAADDEVLLEVLAVALNPIDLAVGSGRFYGGHPPLPYVPGVECVGRIADADRLVYGFGGGIGLSRDGFAAERVVVPASCVIDIPGDTDAAVGAALGTAGLAGWLSVTQRGRATADDVVVVLGATGAVGRVALQAARSVGAQRIVAVGRDEQRLAALGDHADATVPIGGDDLAGRIGAACGTPPTLVVDALWGDPAVAAMAAAGRGARIVQLGASAGAEATVPSAVIRGKQLELLGYSNFGLERSVFVDSYRHLVELSGRGQLSIDVERFALADVGAAWAAAGRGRKAVVCPPLDGGGPT